MYDIKHSNDEAPVMLELWGMQSTTSLPTLPGQLWLVVVAPDGFLSIRKYKFLTFKLSVSNWSWETELFKIELFDI